MGTRSTIALEFADKSVEQVYCHWDGYLSHNGQILQKHYSDPFVLQKLIDLGDISSLGKEIGEKHAFSQFELRAEEVQAYKELTENWTTFYARDRGETGADKKSFVDFQDYLAHHQYEEYDYILRNVNGKATWFVSDHDGAYVELEGAIMDEQDRIAQEETA
jgi:hypothetical protein